MWGGKPAVFLPTPFFSLGIEIPIFMAEFDSHFLPEFPLFDFPYLSPSSLCVSVPLWF